jgi:hypothetical protein
MMIKSIIKMFFMLWTIISIFMVMARKMRNLLNEK